MRAIRDTDRPDAKALEQMRAFELRKPGTRWAAYQNVAMDSKDLGHLKFLAIGADCTLHVAPVQLPDTPPPQSPAIAPKNSGRSG